MRPLLYFIAALIAFVALTTALHVHAQGISQLQQFTSTTSPAAAITQTVYGKAFRLTGQASGCAQFSANGTLTSTGVSCGTGSGGSSFAYPFPSNATSTSIAFNGGLTGVLTGSLVGNADTATALAANGANCSSGNAPLGVNASGAVENCFDVWTEAENTAAAYIASVTADSPLSGSGTSASHLTISAADNTHSGYIAANDYKLIHTATTTFSSPLSYSSGTNAVTCPTCNTSSASVSSIATTWPIIGGTITTSGTLSYGGLSTSSAAVVGNLPYFTGVNTFGNVATGTLSASSPLSLSGTTVIVGSSRTLTIDTSGTWSGNAGTATALAANPTNCSAGNYPLGIDASGNVENCTAAAAGGGSGTVSTSSSETAGQVPYWTSTSGTPATLGGVATGTVSNGTGIAVTAGRSVLGGSLTITNTGVTSLLAGTNISVSAATGAVTITGIGYPFVGDATTTLLTFTGGLTLPNTAKGTIPYASTTNITATLASTTNLTVSGLTAAQVLYAGTNGIITTVATSSETCSSPLSCTAHAVLTGGGAISIADAVADGSTKGAATFTAADFNSSSGNISIDYANGQAANGTTKGFLVAADWLTFNNKIGTSSSLTNGQVLVAGPGGNTVYSVATSSETCSAPLSCGAHNVLAGGGAITIPAASVSADGYLSAANFNIFNNKVATSASETAGQLAVWGTTSGTPPKLYSAATTSVSCSGFLTCTGFNALGSASTITTTGTLTTASGGTNHGNYTAGDVIFAGSGGTSLTEDSSNFFWDDTLNGLGIGTTTPRFNLTIASSTAPQLVLTDASASSAPWYFDAMKTMLAIGTTSPTTNATTSPPAILIDGTGNPSLSIGSTTPTLTGATGILTLGSNGTNGTSTLSAGKYQIDLYDSAGVRRCAFFNASGSWVAVSGACNK